MLSETILDLGKCPNQKTHESESAGFLIWALPEVKNCFRKQFDTKSYIITILKKIVERFVSKNDAKQKGFSIVF